VQIDGDFHSYQIQKRHVAVEGEKQMKVLVTGATGTVGGEVVKALLERGADVRAFTRRQPKLGTFPGAVEIALGDLTDPVSVAEAIKGVDALFLLTGNVADEFTQALTAYGLAKRAGLKHVTYLSVFNADQFLEVPHFAAKYAVEEAIRVGGMPYTILRPGYFVQNERRLKPVLTGPGVYPVPAGNQGLAVVDVRDIAEVAAISLTEEGHKGETYDLVSSELLSGPGAAATWSKLLGKKSLTPDTETSMALKRNCGKQGVRVGWPTIFGSCFRVTSSVDSATRRTRRRALRPCLGTSRERTAASLKN
jgi:uncharacterized protein YbjT (DUF2867 family)